MKWLLLGLIRAYQVTLAGLFAGSCRFQPSCSEYAFTAISTHGGIRGSWLAARRLVRCRPGGGSGFDPVADVNVSRETSEPSTSDRKLRH